MILSRRGLSFSSARSLGGVWKMHPSLVSTPNTNYSTFTHILSTVYHSEPLLGLTINTSSMQHNHKLGLIGSVRDGASYL